MKIIACYNLKGGVGKTATTVNLAYEAARQGARTLIWDMDPQGAASFYFRVKPKVKGGFVRLMRRKASALDAIRGTDYEGLDLLPADFSARHIDLIVDRTKKPKRRLRKMLRSLRKEYDVVYLDCAPSIGVASEVLFRIADALVVPTIPTTLSVNTLKRIKKHLKGMNGTAPSVLPFFSMVDRRKALHRRICADKDALPIDPLRARIPYSSVVEKMGTHRAPVPVFAADSKPARAYAKLGREIAARIG
ncbi:MAG: AAA family ATPase [Planctomycetota bacterium]|nr:AAA family ATPase [Planctomycetota bacterium]